MPARPDRGSPTPADDPAVVEVAAEAMWNAEGGDHKRFPWERLSEPSRKNWRRRAHAALSSLPPDAS
jgi:hypothetical protein